MKDLFNKIDVILFTGPWTDSFSNLQVDGFKYFRACFYLIQDKEMTDVSLTALTTTNVLLE